MKRRKEHLVLKRDGRTEFLRATKLARSIDQAMRSVGIDESWRALELAGVVLTGLRTHSAKMPAPDALGGIATAALLSTSDLADAVQHVLVATGQSNAAVAYGSIGAERARRHHSLVTMDRVSTAATDTVARPSTGRRTGRPSTGRPSTGRPSTGRPSTGRPSTDLASRMRRFGQE